MNEIKLGDKVKCKITGFIGTAVARTEFINGCIQYNVSPRWDKIKNPMEQEVSIDESSLEVIKPKPKPRIKQETGGPNRPGIKQRGY